MAVDMDNVRERVKEWRKSQSLTAPAIAAAIKKLTGYETTRQNLENFLAGKEPKFELIYGLARVMGYPTTDALVEPQQVQGGEMNDNSTSRAAIELSEELTKVILGGGPHMVAMAEAVLREHLKMDPAPKRVQETMPAAA